MLVLVWGRPWIPGTCSCPLSATCQSLDGASVLSSTRPCDENPASRNGAVRVKRYETVPSRALSQSGPCGVVLMSPITEVASHLPEWVRTFERAILGNPAGGRDEFQDLFV